MAKNTEHGFRKGAVKERLFQLNLDEKNGKFVKRDLTTGELTDIKEDNKPFKGVAKEPDKVGTDIVRDTWLALLRCCSVSFAAMKTCPAISPPVHIFHRQAMLSGFRVLCRPMKTRRWNAT